jgi:Co/Zn/Cd efflux system component
MDSLNGPSWAKHDHVILGAGHDQNERKTWAVIALCSVMMIVEIVGGSFYSWNSLEALRQRPCRESTLGVDAQGFS